MLLLVSGKRMQTLWSKNVYGGYEIAAHNRRRQRLGLEDLMVNFSWTLQGQDSIFYGDYIMNLKVLFGGHGKSSIFCHLL